MSFEARVFQILVASPGDVQPERAVIAEVIHEWNYINARERGVVLLPLRWETHSAPELGERPQAVINRQVVDDCDMAVGVFWTRLGTPTGEAASGTAEEIARVGNAGKPVMLYFSKAMVSLDTVDLGEYERLRKFKSETYPRGLIEQYSSLAEFRDKFSRQLAITIRDTIHQGNVATSGKITWGSDSHPVLVVMQGNPLQEISQPVDLYFEKFYCMNEHDIPDFEPEIREYVPGEMRIAENPDPDYYRNVIKYFCSQSPWQEVRIAVKGAPVKLLRDIFIELRIKTNMGKISISDHPPVTEEPRPYRHSIIVGTHFFGGSQINVIGPQSLPYARLDQLSDTEWALEMDILKIQPQRTVCSDNSLYVSTSESATATVYGAIYSSELPPHSFRTEVSLHVVRRELSYKQILDIAGIQGPN